MAMKKPLEVSTTLIEPKDGLVGTLYDPSEAPYHIRNGYGRPMSQYEIDLDRRISVAGVVQSCASSPATINFGNDPLEVSAKVWEMAMDLTERLNNYLAQKK